MAGMGGLMSPSAGLSSAAMTFAHEDEEDEELPPIQVSGHQKKTRDTLSG